MCLEKRKILLNSVFGAKFYYTTNWMLPSRQNNKKIKHLHKKYRQPNLNDQLSSYEALVEKNGSVSVHHRNIQSLAIEMFQIKHDPPREIVTDILTQETRQYNFRISSVNTVYHSSESISYLGPKM